MNKVYSLLLMLLSAPVFACPAFSGDFLCLQDGEEITMKIKVVSQSPFTVLINEKKFLLNNKWDKFEEEGVKGEQRLECPESSNSIDLHFVGDFYNSKNEKFGQFDIINHFQLTPNNQLNWQQIGEYNFDFQKDPWPVFEQTTCRRL